MYGYESENYEERKKKIIKLSIIIGAAVIVSFFLFSTIICLVAHQPTGATGIQTMRNANFDEIDLSQFYPYLK